MHRETGCCRGGRLRSDTEAYSNSNANSANPAADPNAPPTTVSSPTNDSRDNDGLKDDNVEKRLYSALVERCDEALACPRDPSPLGMAPL